MVRKVCAKILHPLHMSPGIQLHTVVFTRNFKNLLLVNIYKMCNTVLTKNPNVTELIPLFNKKNPHYRFI